MEAFSPFFMKNHKPLITWLLEQFLTWSPKLSWIQFCLSIISFAAWPVLDWMSLPCVSFANQTRSCTLCQAIYNCWWTSPQTFLPCLVLKMCISLVMQPSGSFTKSTISFSYESSYELMCILLHRMARVKLTVSTTTPRRFIQVMGIASFLSKIFKT